MLLTYGILQAYIVTIGEHAAAKILALGKKKHN